MTDRDPAASAASAASVTRGMRAQLSRRADDLAGGAAPVGWKIGFNTPAIQEHFGLTSRRRLPDGHRVSPDGATVSLTGWARPPSRSRSPSGSGLMEGRRAGPGARARRPRHLIRRHRAGPRRQHLSPRRDLRGRGPRRRSLDHGGEGTKAGDRGGRRATGRRPGRDAGVRPLVPRRPRRRARGGRPDHRGVRGGTGRRVPATHSMSRSGRSAGCPSASKTDEWWPRRASRRS